MPKQTDSDATEILDVAKLIDGDLPTKSKSKTKKKPIKTKKTTSKHIQKDTKEVKKTSKSKSEFESEEDFEKRIVRVYKETTAFGVNDLALKGEDIMEIFELKQSPLVGRVKKHLLSKVLSDQKLNNRVDLIKLAATYINRLKRFSEDKKK